MQSGFSLGLHTTTPVLIGSPINAGPANAGQVYYRLPRSGTLTSLYVSLQNSSTTVVGTAPATVTIAVFLAPTTADPATLEPTFANVLSVPLIYIGPIGPPPPATATFRSANIIGAAVPVTAGDYLAVNVSSDLEVITFDGITTVEAGIGFA